jgi:2-oxoglutarate decarboxylase
VPQPSAQSGSHASVQPSNDLGANEWLVEEMRESYQADPSSVSEEWAAYFGANGASADSSSGDGSASSARAAEKSQSASAPAQESRKTPQSAEKQPSAKQEQPPAQKGEAKSTPPSVARPRPDTAAAEPAKGTSTPVAKDATKAAPAEAGDEPSYTVLRGAPARTATNMESSLTVPTATSVRSVPVKLLWDNRTVINNHLAEHEAARSPSRT